MKRRTSSPVILDARVIFTLIISGVVSVGLMLLSFRNNNEEPCYPVKIVLKSGIPYTGQSLQFETEGKDVPTGNMVWTFDDTVSQLEKGTTASHSFHTPGKKKIRLTIGQNCAYDTSINIYEPIRKTVSRSPVQFSGPSKAFVGQPVAFKDSTSWAKQWAWRFGENDSIDATIQRPDYVFKYPGTKIIELVVNGTDRREMKIIVSLRPKKPVYRRPTVSDQGPTTAPVPVQVKEDKEQN